MVIISQNPSNPKSKDPLRDPTTATMFPRCTATDTRCWPQTFAHTQHLELIVQ